MVASERDSNPEGTALIRALPKDQRQGILLPDALRYRERRERSPIAPVIATRPGGGEAPGDRILVEAEWEVVERIVEAAQLSNEERACYLLHHQHGWTDQEIATLYGLRRATVVLRRQAAAKKIEALVSSLPSEAD